MDDSYFTAAAASESGNPAKGAEAIKAALEHAPLLPGVYRMLNARGEILYIGKARQLRARLTNYTQLGVLSYRILRMVAQVARVEYTTTQTEAEALLLEAHLIKTVQPRYNILLKDDKSFPYIALTSDHAFPQITKHRGTRNPKHTYFGPFASASAVNETLATLQKAFLLRPCTDSVFSNRSRPCLQHQIKRCSAPCVGLIGEEDYAELTRQAKRFLSGRSRDVQTELQAQMQQASDAMEYERAARLRDRLAAVTRVVQQQRGSAHGVGDADVIAMARSGATACVVVVCIRSGQNYGMRSYFPAHSAEREDGDVINAFLGQFYASRPIPALILLSHPAHEMPLVAEALGTLAKHAVEIAVPQRGDKRLAVQDALENAKMQLARRAAEDAANAQWLEAVGQLFGTASTPKRIEVYDNSHIQGAHAIGAMVVATADGLDKKQYRTYNFPREIVQPKRPNPGGAMQGGGDAKNGGDDFAMMRAMLQRRLKRLVDDKLTPDHPHWPDVLLIDGGLGQLGVVQEVLETLGLAGHVLAVGIAKGVDRNAGREQFFVPGKPPFQLPVNDPVLHYLQRLRDEAHRFAIGTHRNKRSKALVQSPLDTIDGIGPTRKKALLKHFGSARDVSNASIAELQRVPGINAALAEQIYAHFHG